MDIQIDEYTDRWMDGWKYMDGFTDGWMDMDGCMDNTDGWIYRWMMDIQMDG